MWTLQYFIELKTIDPESMKRTPSKVAPIFSTGNRLKTRPRKSLTARLMYNDFGYDDGPDFPCFNYFS